MTVEGIAGQVPTQVARDRWDAASYRCPCGFATDDSGEFDRHLDAAEGTELEHFEVLGGWTFQQVRQWQAAAAASGGGPVIVRAAGAR